jgi:hypothetical protein
MIAQPFLRNIVSEKPSETIRNHQKHFFTRDFQQRSLLKETIRNHFSETIGNYQIASNHSPASKLYSLEETAEELAKPNKEETAKKNTPASSTPPAPSQIFGLRF